MFITLKSFHHPFVRASTSLFCWDQWNFIWLKHNHTVIKPWICLVSVVSITNISSSVLCFLPLCPSTLSLIGGAAIKDIKIPLATICLSFQCLCSDQSLQLMKLGPIFFLKACTLDLVALACSYPLKHGEEKGRERKVYVNSKTFGRHRLSCSRDPAVLLLTHMCFLMLLAIWSHKRIKSSNCHLSWLRICTYLYLISQ